MTDRISSYIHYAASRVRSRSDRALTSDFRGQFIMTRLARHYVPEQPQHVILQGLTGPAFLDEGDYLYFLACLADAARVADLAVHAWVLMPDAVQFLVTPSYESSVAMAMQAVGRRYVETFNRRHGRRGTVWRGGYNATVIEPDRYFLLASQVIDHAPVRNRLV